MRVRGAGGGGGCLVALIDPCGPMLTQMRRANMARARARLGVSIRMCSGGSCSNSSGGGGGSGPQWIRLMSAHVGAESPGCLDRT